VPSEPPSKRVVAFVDAQNLFHAAKEAFGYRYPNFDPLKLARGVCESRAWRLEETRLYTGVPAAADNPFWNHFWTAKLAQMGREGVVTYARALRYRNQTVRLPDNREQTGAAALDQDRLCLSVEPHEPERPRYQRNGLDPDRQGHLRVLRRLAGLPSEGNAMIARSAARSREVAR
jgi:hypothetical protein